VAIGYVKLQLKQNKELSYRLESRAQLHAVRFIVILLPEIWHLCFWFYLR